MQNILSLHKFQITKQVAVTIKVARMKNIRYIFISTI